MAIKKQNNARLGSVIELSPCFFYKKYETCLPAHGAMAQKMLQLLFLCKLGISVQWNEIIGVSVERLCPRQDTEARLQLLMVHLQESEAKALQSLGRIRTKATQMFGILKELYTETYSIKCRLSLAFVDPDLIGFGLSVSSLNGEFWNAHRNTSHWGCVVVQAQAICDSPQLMNWGVNSMATVKSVKSQGWSMVHFKSVGHQWILNRFCTTILTSIAKNQDMYITPPTLWM